jgi:trimethylamine--corrinoid protein Co-methyltransferase
VSPTRAGSDAVGPEFRHPRYRSLRNPFTSPRSFSDDRVAAIHAARLRVLEELGLEVLLPEARALLARAGALVNHETET